MSWFGDDDSSWGWKVGGSSSGSDWAFSTGSSGSGGFGNSNSNNSETSWAFSTGSNQGSGGNWAYSPTFTHGFDAIRNWGEFPIDNNAYAPHYLSEAFKKSSGAAGLAPLAKIWEALPARPKRDPFAQDHPAPQGGGRGKEKADDSSWTPMKDYWGRIPLRGGNPKEPAVPAAPPPLPHLNTGVFDTNSNALPRPWNQAAGSGYQGPNSSTPQNYYGSQPSFTPSNPYKK